MAKILVIQGFHSDTKQLMIQEEYYGSREANQRLGELSKRYPTYKFRMWAK